MYVCFGYWNVPLRRLPANSLDDGKWFGEKAYVLRSQLRVPGTVMRMILIVHTVPPSVYIRLKAEERAHSLACENQRFNRILNPFHIAFTPISGRANIFHFPHSRAWHTSRCVFMYTHSLLCLCGSTWSLCAVAARVVWMRNVVFHFSFLHFFPFSFVRRENNLLFSRTAKMWETWCAHCVRVWVCIRKTRCWCVS